MKNEWQRHVAASFSITPTTTSNHSAYVPSRARRIYRRFIRRKIPSSHPLILWSGTMMETRSNNSLIPFSSVSLPASPLHLEIFVAQFASSEFVPRGIFITGESFFAKEFFPFTEVTLPVNFCPIWNRERMLKVEKVNHLLVN